MVHPGVKRNHLPRILIARDESGSVSDEMVAVFNDEMTTLVKRVEIDFLPFDSVANIKDVVHCRSGRLPEKVQGRTKHGGTSFDAPTAIYNDPANRSRWDALIIMTDGECSEPMGINHGKRAWVIAPGRKLAFETDELQILVETGGMKDDGPWALDVATEREGGWVA